MNTKNLLLFISILTVSLLSSCSNTKLIGTEFTATPLVSTTPRSEPSPTVNNLEQKLTDSDIKFLTENAPKGKKLSSVLFGNVDASDKEEEIVAIYGTDDVETSNVFVIKKQKDKLSIMSELKNSISSIGGITTGVKLISLKNDCKQIALEVGVEGDGEITEIYEISGNEPKMLFSFGTGDEKLESQIKDVDNDGIDEIIETIAYDDFQKHILNTTKKWDGTQFKVIDKTVSYGNDTGKFIQPDTASDVLRCYIELVILGIENEEEMNLLVENGSANAINGLDLSPYFDESKVFQGFPYDLQESFTEYADGKHYSVHIPDSEIIVEVRSINERLMITGYNDNMYQ